MTRTWVHISLYFVSRKPIWSLSISAQQDVVLPLSTPIRGVDGQEIREVTVPNNTKIVVGIRASNCNLDLWGADAYEWKPERWLKQLPFTVTDAHIPGVYSNLQGFFPHFSIQGMLTFSSRMTFNGGSRSCMWASSFQYISPAVITDFSFLSQWLQIFSARNEWVRIYHQ